MFDESEYLDTSKLNPLQVNLLSYLKDFFKQVVLFRCAIVLQI